MSIISFNAFKNPIGIDISDYRIRFMQLDFRRNPAKARLRSYGEVVVPKDLIKNGIINDLDEVVLLLKKLLQHPSYGKIDSRYIYGSLPDKKTFLKLITIPDVPDEELIGAIEWGIENNIPVSLDAIYYDWKEIPMPNILARAASSRKSESPNKYIIVSVAPRSIVDSYTRAIKSAGLIPLGLENESLAVARCLLPTTHLKKNKPLNKPNPCFAIVDIGRSRTNFMLFHHNVILYNSTINISGTMMTELIAKSMNLNNGDAEKAKIICGLDDRKARGVIKNILRPVIDQLAKNISEGIDYYTNYLNPESHVYQLLLTGSVSKMVGLSQFLQNKLKLPVSVGNPLVNLPRVRSEQKFAKVDFSPFSTACGLSMRRN